MGGEPLHLSGLVLGAAGAISGSTGAVFPHLPVKLWDAFVNRDIDRAMAIQKKMTAVTRVLLTTHANWPQMVKEAIHIVWGLEMGRNIVGYSPVPLEEIKTLERTFEISIFFEPTRDTGPARPKSRARIVQPGG